MEYSLAAEPPPVTSTLAVAAAALSGPSRPEGHPTQLHGGNNRLLDGVVSEHPPHP